MSKELKMGTGNYKHKPHSEETKRKIGLSRKGIKHTEESKLKMGHSNEEHYKWKGDEANNNVLHVWVAKNKPKPKKCEECGHIRKLNLASLTNHNYTRNIEDYKWLCYSCHKKLDMKCKCCGETNKKMHLFMICSDCKEDGFVNIRLLKRPIILELDEAKKHNTSAGQAMQIILNQILKNIDKLVGKKLTKELEDE